MSDFEAAEPQVKPRRLKRWQIIALIVLVSFLVRAWSAWQLPIDADEPVYSQAGRGYAERIKAGDLAGIINLEQNREHPALVKLMYSIPYLLVEPKFGSMTENYANRGISVLFGTLAVLVLALVDPWAGAFLALHSMTIKYTSEIYLEAMPLFFSLLAVLAFQRALSGKRRWFWISAAALGVAVAGKYLYGVAIVPILVMMIMRRPFQVKQLLLFAAGAAAAFYAFNPSLWLNPIGGLWDSLTFHLRYTQSTEVVKYSFPWYQPFEWVSHSVPWHPQVFFYPTVDILVFWLAIPGVVAAWKPRRWVSIWTLAAMATLLVWPTKWPQYTLILIPAMCLAAASSLYWLFPRIREYENVWHWGELVLPQPGKLFWGALILFSSALVIGKVSFEIDLANARRGWTPLTENTSPLPSNTIHDIAISQAGEVVMGTDAGVAIWKPGEDVPWGSSPSVLNTINSGLVDDAVLAVLQDRDGSWWYGTQSGLSHLSNGKWQTYRGADMGLNTDQVQNLMQDSRGRIWVATKAGAAVLESSQWTTYTRQNSPLPDDAVFTLAAQTISTGEVIWFGTLPGVSRFDTKTNQWISTDLSAYGLGWGGVSDLLIDRQGNVWAATLGGGVSMWNGAEWTSYRSSNSGLPKNSVQRMLEVEPGVFWFGLANMSEPGGMMASYDGTTWKSYHPLNSGFTGAEPLALAKDPAGRIWIGTNLSGVIVYQPPK